jgi:Na+/H+ antiporter NhaC
MEYLAFFFHMLIATCVLSVISSYKLDTKSTIRGAMIFTNKKTNKPPFLIDSCSSDFT